MRTQRIPRTARTYGTTRTNWASRTQGIPGLAGLGGIGSSHAQPNATQVIKDTSDLENTFQGVANVLERIAGQQVCTTETLNDSVREQQRERENSQRVLEDLAKASHVNTFQHILASIPYFNGTGNIHVINWLERIEATCLFARRDPRTEALGHCGGKVLDSILLVPSTQPWTVLKTTLI